MVTIFTPVYNRAYIIERLYKSLLNQTSYNFEWIIVDDGSQDNLESMVNDWIAKEPPFDIIYKYVVNGGKHRAINIAAKLARGNAFFIVDSDDYVAKNAVEFIEREFSKIENDVSFAGIAGLRKYYNHADIIGGNPNFEHYIDATNLEREKYGLLGDKAEIYKTDVWKKYPLPEYEGETFLLEEVTLNRIALDGLKLRWYNTVIYYCEYLKDGLTRNMFERLVENPLGWAAQIKTVKLCGNNKQFAYDAYMFFEAMHKKYDKIEICELIKISKDEYDIFVNKWNRIISMIEEKIAYTNSTLIAIYGMGRNAKRLKLYLEELSIDIAYVIDRDAKNIDSKYDLYTLEEDIPPVENMCVTLQNPSKELFDSIKSKLKSSYVWLLKETDDEVW